MSDPQPTLSSAEPPIDPALEAAYLTAQARAHWPATIAGFAARSAEIPALPGFVADVGFGPHPRQRFDLLVPVGGRPRAIVAYLHPGYWQMRDRALFRFLMPSFAAMGCAVAMVGYPLCPEVTLAELTEASRAAVPALIEASRARWGNALPIVAAGHSAGGHLAVEWGLTDWRARGLAADPIAAVLALSGVYDLEPLVATSLNRALRLVRETARAASPLLRVGSRGCPALFAVGGGETPAFLDQNARMAAAWGAAGHDARVLVVDDADHFSLIAALEAPTSALRRAVADLIEAVEG